MKIKVDEIVLFNNTLEGKNLTDVKKRRPCFSSGISSGLRKGYGYRQVGRFEWANPTTRKESRLYRSVDKK